MGSSFKRCPPSRPPKSNIPRGQNGRFCDRGTCWGSKTLQKRVEWPWAGFSSSLDVSHVRTPIEAVWSFLRVRAVFALHREKRPDFSFVDRYLNGVSCIPVGIDNAQRTTVPVPSYILGHRYSVLARLDAMEVQVVWIFDSGHTRRCHTLSPLPPRFQAWCNPEPYPEILRVGCDLDSARRSPFTNYYR